MKAKVIDDKEQVTQIRKAIKENDGYCPCKLLKIPENKCICQEFIKQVPIGETCSCGLYIKIEN